MNKNNKNVKICHFRCDKKNLSKCFLNKILLEPPNLIKFFITFSIKSKGKISSSSIVIIKSFLNLFIVGINFLKTLLFLKTQNISKLFKLK